MGKSFNNVNDLFNALHDDLADALEDKDFVEEIKDVMVEQIKDEVYEKYTPRFYKRQGANGGLIDKQRSILGKADRETLVLNVYNYRKGFDNLKREGRYVTPVIVTGEGYNGVGVDSKGRTNATPRDFLKATEEELKKTGKHIDGIKRSLKRKGHNIR